ncbi:MAG: hypothetical protein AAF614_04515 [Chloroflexota bacterium]
MSAIVSATRTHALKAVILVMLWFAVATLLEWSVEVLTIGALLAFPLGIWFFSATSNVGSVSRERIAALNPSAREWWGILLGLVLGVLAGAFLFNWLTENQSESVITVMLTRWGLFFGALGAWLGRWLIGTVGGVSLKLPTLAIAWGLRQWSMLFLLVIGGLVLFNQFATISEDTGAIEATVPYSDLIVPIIFVALFAYWIVQLAWGTQQRVAATYRSARSSSRWFIIAATIFGAIIGITLTVPNNEGSQLLTPDSATAALVTGGAGWYTASRLLRLAQPVRTILTWSFMVAAGVVALVYNLPGAMGTVPNALTAGGFFGLLAGVVQMRFSLWAFLRMLGLAILGAILIVNQAGFSFAQIYALVGLILGLMATMMIFNWVSNR